MRARTKSRKHISNPTVLEYVKPLGGVFAKQDFSALPAEQATPRADPSAIRSPPPPP